MRIALGLALLGAGCVFACGSSSNNSVGGTAGADMGAAGDDGSNGGKGSAGKGNTAGADNGDAGEGGAAGSPPVVIVSTAKPHTAVGLVAGGVVAHSTHFTGVFSLGAGPGGNRIMTSANNQLRGGVLGASQQ